MTKPNREERSRQAARELLQGLVTGQADVYCARHLGKAVAQIIQPVAECVHLVIMGKATAREGGAILLHRSGLGGEAVIVVKSPLR